MPTGPSEHNERQQKIDRIMKRMRERLEQEWPESETDVTGIEEIVLRIEQEVLREVTEEMLREQSRMRRGNRSVCGCGKLARYRKDSPLEVVTLFGRVHVDRAYFYCPACGAGHCPQDRAWRLGLGNTTPTVQALVAALGAFGSYTQAPVLLRRVRPQVRLDVKTVERLSQRVGAEIAAAPPPGYAEAQRSLAVAV